MVRNHEFEELVDQPFRVFCMLARLMQSLSHCRLGTSSSVCFLTRIKWVLSIKHSRLEPDGFEWDEYITE
jgi:hypothetical protein